MRLGIVIIALFAFLSSNASAQSFEGAYAGVHAGYRWGVLDLSSPAYTFPDGAGGTVQVPARSESYSINGPLIGAHAGYNFLLNPEWLVGVEGDIAAVGGSSKSRSAAFSSVAAPDDDCDEDCPATVTASNRVSQADLGWQATLRARLGFIDGATLYYAAAGLAWIQADWTETVSTGTGSMQSVNRSMVVPGWTVGVGAETFIDQDWIARIEYLYEDFSSTNVPLAFTSRQGTIDIIAHKLRLGVSLKF